MAQAARDLDLHINVLRKWVSDHGADPGGVFPGHGQMRPEQLEIDVHQGIKGEHVVEAMDRIESMRGTQRLEARRNTLRQVPDRLPVRRRSRRNRPALAIVT